MSKLTVLQETMKTNDRNPELENVADLIFDAL